jgi:hypothetical protein
MTLVSRKTVLLAKQESTEGVDPTPTASADAIYVENPQFTLQSDTFTTGEASGTLDTSAPEIGGTRGTVQFSTVFRGTGTAGTAARWGQLLEACGVSENIVSAISSEALQDGGTTTTAILDTSYGTTDDQHSGYKVDINSSPTFISNYVGISKTATLTDTQGSALDSGDTIVTPAQVVYKTISDSIPSLTFYFYRDGLLYKFHGCRGDVNFSLTTSQPSRASFTFQGIFDTVVTDAAVPTPTFDVDTVDAPSFKGGTFTIDRTTAEISSLNLSLNNQLVFPADPNQAQGFKAPIIVGRNVTGSFDPALTLVATRDLMSSYTNNTEVLLNAQFGSSTGNSFGLTIPSAKLTSNNPGDRSGVATTSNNFAATGFEESFYLSVY